MTKVLFFLIVLSPMTSWAGFSNYNSILFGERAAGMGGAYTALSDDPAACPYYNPATLARMDGPSLSAAISLYNKYDINYGAQNQFGTAPMRVNQGNFVPIPASSGSVYTLRNFAFALSILIPDFEAYTGQIEDTPQVKSVLNSRDSSLWVGGSIALNISEKDALGLTMYYTARTFSRSLSDELTSGGQVTLLSEEKFLTQNSIVYILGYYHRFNPNWSVGFSVRPPSVAISGHGSFYQTQIDTSGALPSTVRNSRVGSATQIPVKSTLGVAYERAGLWTTAFDLSYYAPVTYHDLGSTLGSDTITHEPVWNANFGEEFHLKNHLALRLGLFTNYSSRPKIPVAPDRRYGDHIDMWGFSSNLAVYTSEHSKITLGGYYSGGRGFSTEQSELTIKRIKKSNQIFSFLVGTSFHF